MVPAAPAAAAFLFLNRALSLVKQSGALQVQNIFRETTKKL